jgi:uncharacterized protein YaaQ
MKLLVAIVRDEFAADVAASLNEAGLGVTRISTTGGFWRRGNVTLLVGMEEAEVDTALNIIDTRAGPEIDESLRQGEFPPHRATIFLLDVDSFAQF